MLVSPAILGAALVAGNAAQANEASDAQVLNQLEQYSLEGAGASLNQVGSVFDLRDVSPSDWAFDALRSLVERYGCIQGYPDRTFRGNKSMTRYEFAAGLNACLDSVSRIIADGGMGQEDMAQLQRLVSEFEAELATLGARVDDLEARTEFLEDHQFSTTTKLNGEVVVALTDSFGTGDTTQITLGDRFRLALETSFTGDDLLITRFAGGNLAAANSASTQTFNLGANGNNAVIDWIAYYNQFKGADVFIAANGGIHSDYVATINPGLEDYDGGDGALSTFASESPIYRIGGGVGAGASFGLGDIANFTLGYLSEGGGSPAQGAGLFNGEYSLLAQLDFDLTDKATVGLTYVNAYQGSTTTNGVTTAGLFDAGGDSNIVGVYDSATAAGTIVNAYGIEAAYQFTDAVSFSAFGMFADADTVVPGTSLDYLSYGFGLAVSDFGGEDNLLGLFAGASPYVDSARNAAGALATSGSPFHVEGFYKYQLNDSVSVTPGIIWLSNSTQQVGATGAAGGDVVIGTLRTTFNF